MNNENNEINMKKQTVQKKEWEQPQLIELDINETESGTTKVLELGGLTGNIKS